MLICISPNYAQSIQEHEKAQIKVDFKDKIAAVRWTSLAVPSLCWTVACTGFTTATTYLQIKYGIKTPPSKLGMGIIIGLMWPVSIGSGALSYYLTKKSYESIRKINNHQK